MGIWLKRCWSWDFIRNTSQVVGLAVWQMSLEFKRNVCAGEIDLGGWCWSWKSNILTTWCEELPHLKGPWCWERLKAGGEGDDRGWDGCMASPTQCTWVWVNSGSWWWTGRPGMLQFMGRIESDMTEWLNTTELNHVMILKALRTEVTKRGSDGCRNGRTPHPALCSWVRSHT